MSETQPVSELPRAIEIEQVVPEGVEVEIEANEAERARIAGRLELLGVERLSALLLVKPSAGGAAIRVDGRITAKVVQRCVVSLARLENEIDEPLMVEFRPAAGTESEVDFTVDDADPPEPLNGDRIDLGELVVQHLAIALDPYPRKSGAQAPGWQDEVDMAANSGGDSPFSVLAELKKKRD